MAGAEIYRARMQPGGAAALTGAGADAFGAPIGEAVERAAGRRHQQNVSAYSMELQRQYETEAAEAGVEFARMQGGVSARIGELREAAGPGGAGHRETVAAELEARTGAYLNSIGNARLRGAFAPRVAELRSRVETEEDGWSRGRRVEHQVQSAGEIRRLFANQHTTSPNPEALENDLATHRTMIEAMGLPYDVTQPLIREGEREIVNGLTVGIRRQNPSAARELLQSGIFNQYLTPQDIESGLSQADSDVRRLEAQEAARINLLRGEVRERVARAEEMINDGIDVPDEDLEALGRDSVAAGLDGQEYDVAIMRTRAQVVRETVSWPAERWEREINGLLERGDARTPVEDVRLNQLQRLAPARLQELRDNPAQWAARNGAAPPPIDFANPATLHQRAAWRGGVARATGRPNVDFFTPQEAASLRAAVDGSSQQRIELAAQLITIGDPGSMQVAVRQIAGDDPVFRHAIRLATLPGTTGAMYMRDVLNGPDALRANPGIWDQAKAEVVLAEVVPALRALPAEFRAGFRDTARHLYASQYSRAGGVAWDENAYRMALHRAAGAYGEGAAMAGGLKPMRFGSSEALVLLPSGMTQSQFEERWARIPEQIPAQAVNGRPVWANGQPVLVGQWRNLIPVAVGDGIYQVSSGGNSFVVTPDGTPFRMDLRRATGGGRR